MVSALLTSANFSLISARSSMVNFLNELSTLFVAILIWFDLILLCIYLLKYAHNYIPQVRRCNIIKLNISGVDRCKKTPLFRWDFVWIFSITLQSTLCIRIKRYIFNWHYWGASWCGSLYSVRGWWGNGGGLYSIKRIHRNCANQKKKQQISKVYTKSSRKRYISKYI